MSDENPFAPRAPRPDMEQTFPPRLVDSLGPGVLTTMAQISAALVGAELLDLIARRGGSRVMPSAVQEALDHLDHAVTEDVRAHCRDEARRIADWIERPPVVSEAPPPPLDDLGLMHAADIRSRISVAQWAMDAGLELELEWYEPAKDLWPRERGFPLQLRDAGADEACLVIETSTGEYEIPVVNIRWLMPVEPRVRASAPRARVLTFPGAPLSEEE